MRITKEDISTETTETETTDKMSVVLVPAIAQNEQAVIPKSMVLDPGWFNRDRMKFKD